MYSWQDFEKEKVGDVSRAIHRAISENKGSDMVRTAVVADAYDRQQNVTITNFVKMLYTRNGQIPDVFSSNHRICSNFFRRLNTQRVAYSLGNGVTFTGDGVKERLGADFDTKLKDAAYLSLKHGVTFMYWNVDRVHVFPVTEFAPLWDEDNGELAAGVRYWQADPHKPMQAVLYEKDGFTVYRADSSGAEFREFEPKRAYKLTVRKAPADDAPEIVGEDVYGELPIIPLYGSRLQQSTLIGMRGGIDAFDLIRSGFANDLSDCSEIYWIISNAGGMDDSDLARFRERMMKNHIVNVADGEDQKVTPYVQDIPYQARKVFLDDIRSGIYEDFGALDVHSVDSASTNDHLEAAYQPMDENADDFEYQIIETVQRILRLIGVEDVPQFKRNRISNESERTNMILSAANYLDDETVLSLLPFVTPDMIEQIMERRDEERYDKFAGNGDEMTPNDDEDEEQEDEE